MSEEIGFWKWLAKKILDIKSELIDMKYYVIFVIFSIVAIRVCPTLISNIVLIILIVFSILYLLYLFSCMMKAIKNDWI